MSKAYSIQKKLWKAYGKVGKALGREFSVYRPTELTDPMRPTNWLFNTDIAFSQDWKYKSPHKWGVSLWKTWVDGRLNRLTDIEQGDIFYDSLRNETYFVASTQEHLDIQSIKANERITISRAGYTDGANGFGPGDTEVATDVPCYIEEPGSGGGNLGYIPAASYSTDSVPSYIVFLVDNNNEIEIRDAITDDKGRRFQVLNIDDNDVGRKLSCSVYTP